MTEQKSTVCAVVVTFNRLDLLKECIDAIRSQSHPADMVLVVNNGSTDGTREWLDAQADLKVVHQENLGGAGGFFTGIKQAYEKGSGAVWVMDDDVIPETDALKLLIGAWQELPTGGFFASRVIGTDGQPLNVPTLDRRSLPNGSPAWAERILEGFLALKSATFVSVLIPRATIASVGFPIAEMFIWGDDVEYTTRISRKYASFWALQSTVVHKRANQKNLSIVDETNPKRLNLFRYLYRNNLFIAIKYRDTEMLGKYVLSLGKDVCLCIGKPFFFQKLSAMAQGLFEGLSFVGRFRGEPRGV